jgi:hypothetical protein
MEAAMTEQEPRWLVSLVASTDVDESVQGYQFTAPAGLTVVPARSPADPSSRPKGEDRPIKFLEFQLKQVLISG